MQAFKIDWKDDKHHLTKLYPRVADDADDDMPAENGSFFNFFELADDPFDVRSVPSIYVCSGLTRSQDQRDESSPVLATRA